MIVPAQSGIWIEGLSQGSFCLRAPKLVRSVDIAICNQNLELFYPFAGIALDVFKTLGPRTAFLVKNSVPNVNFSRPKVAI